MTAYHEMSKQDYDRFPLVNNHNDINGSSQHYGVLATGHNLLTVTPKAGGVGVPLLQMRMMRCKRAHS